MRFLRLDHGLLLIQNDRCDMTQRFNPGKQSPAAFKGLLAMHDAVDGSGLDKGLIELIRLRISQINGCAYCISMHVPLGRERGLSEEKMHMLSGWREAECYAPDERAALALAEAVTLLPGKEVPDGIFQTAVAQFGETNVTHIVFAALEMNTWNRLMITMNMPPKRFP